MIDCVLIGVFFETLASIEARKTLGIGLFQIRPDIAPPNESFETLSEKSILIFQMALMEKLVRSMVVVEDAVEALMMPPIKK